MFWIKELITWGTLEPVAAYLLAQGGETIRPAAERVAQSYYAEQSQDLPPNELLNAGTIRDWVQRRLSPSDSSTPASVPTEIKVKLCEDFSHAPVQEWRVLPAEAGEQIYWCDPAGFPLAISLRPEGWRSAYTETHDFKLEPSKKVVYSSTYI